MSIRAAHRDMCNEKNSQWTDEIQTVYIDENKLQEYNEYIRHPILRL